MLGEDDPVTLKPFQVSHQELTVEGDCQMRGIRVVIPKKLQGRSLWKLHRDHPGISRMKSLTKSHVWRPGLNKDIDDLAKSCMHGSPKCQACARRAGLGGRPPPSARGSTCEHGTHQLTSLC